ETTSGFPVVQAGKTGADAAAGNYLAVFGGRNGLSQAEFATLTQELVLPAEQALSLSFFLQISQRSGFSDDYLWVYLDGDLLTRIRQNNSQYWDQYKEVTLDLTPYADGEA